MLEDRSYMRQSPFSPRRSLTVTLLIINVVVFFAQVITEEFTRFPIGDYFYLSLEGLRHGYVWQLLSYAFLHVGPLHLLFNCWAIYVFGLDVEEALGRKQFLALYLSSGVVGGLVQELAALISYNNFGGPVVGASAAAFGLGAAFAVLFPDRILMLFFIIPIRAKYLLLLGAGLALYGVLRPSGTYAHAAHLGGMLSGAVFVRYAVHWSWHWPQLRRPLSRAPRRLVRVPSRGASGGWGRAKPDEELGPEEFVSKQVDPILDKISAHGIQSLTERERRILEAAREKMGKR